MQTFKIYWINGTTEILMGRDIADAFNSVGYTKDHVESMERYVLVINADPTLVDSTIFSCGRCKSMPTIENKDIEKWLVYCPDCRQNAQAKLIFEQECDAKMDWNKKQLKYTRLPLDTGE